MSLLDYLRNTLADSDSIGAEPKNQNSYVFHYLGGDRRESTQIGRKKLVEAGALLQVDNNIHDKIICVDDHTLIMGSFNWLSANRTKKYAKEERSSVNRGKEIAAEINKYWKRVRGMPNP